MSEAAFTPEPPQQEPQPLTRAERLALEAPTQARYPWRATVRTALAIVLGLATAAPVIVQILDEGLSGWEAAGIGGQVLAVSTIVTRLMAVAAVNDALSKIGLGATPTPSEG